MARITHEGLALLRQQDVNASKSFELRHSSQIAIARHSTKLLDNSSASLDELVTLFRQTLTSHQQVFGDKNIAIVSHERRVYYSTLMAAYEGLAGDPNNSGRPSQPSLEYNIADEMGRTIGALCQSFGRQLILPQTLLELRPVSPEIATHDADKFLMGRFPGTTVGHAALLLSVEGATSSALNLFEDAQESHTTAVFRAQWVVASHALSAVRKIADNPQTALSATAQDHVNAVYQSRTSQQLLQSRILRNHCMHYGIAPNLESLSTDRPAFGLVEATSSFSFPEARQIVRTTLRSISDMLLAWPRGAKPVH
ncbi:hypothetical protein BFL34_00730 [Clavibacter michiganensis]|uniref:Uncharacterized protein n=2 Tax=Clavibacter michiganensis TaxID=28447 RepID=A0A251YBC8_9MICO|nr:hypothetical protein BFL34_00730 [Clavibacter michiganensis]